MNSFRRRRSCRSERGAALVEAALVLLPLSLIIFGIIEFGFIFKDSLTLSSATRAGARTASAEPMTGTGAQDSINNTFLLDTVAATARAASAGTFTTDDQLWIYSADSNGNPVGGCPSTTCAVFGYQTAASGWSGTHWQLLSGGWDPQTQVACLGDPATQSVGVHLTLHHKAVTGLFANLTMQEKTVMRFEPVTSNC